MANNDDLTTLFSSNGDVCETLSCANDSQAAANEEIKVVDADSLIKAKEPWRSWTAHPSYMFENWYPTIRDLTFDTLTFPLGDLYFQKRCV